MAKTQNTETKVENNEEYRVAAELPANMIVTVRNGFQGRLIYISKRTGERYIWESFGDEQDMELKELKNAKNSSKAFFENNWFLIDNPAVIDYLGVTQYYKNALTYDTFDAIFSKKPSEVKKIVAKLSDGQRATLSYRAMQLVSEGRVDSIQTIKALEESLGIELTAK